jgi:hypothetical protein
MDRFLAYWAAIFSYTDFIASNGKVTVNDKFKLNSDVFMVHFKIFSLYLCIHPEENLKYNLRIFCFVTKIQI